MQNTVGGLCHSGPAKVSSLLASAQGMAATMIFVEKTKCQAVAERLDHLP